MKTRLLSSADVAALAFRPEPNVPALSNSKFSRLLLSFLMFLNLAATSQKTWFVSTTGNNANDGTTAFTAWKTMQYANNNTLVTNGDTIQVLAGNYTETVNITKSLKFYGPNYDISPNPGTERRITEAIINAPPGTKPENTRVFEAYTPGTSVEIKGFKLMNGRPITDGNRLRNPTQDVVIVFEKNWVSHGDALFFGSKTLWKTVSVIDNFFEDISLTTTSSALKFNDANVPGAPLRAATVDAVITDNRIDRTTWAGILLDNISSAIILRNVIRNVPETGIKLAGGMGNATVSLNDIQYANTAGTSVGAFYIYGSDFTGSVNFTNNIVRNSHNGFSIRAGENIEGKTINVTNNSFDGSNTGYSIFNDGNGTLNAPCNWFGSSDVTTVSSGVLGNAKFIPFLSSGNYNGSVQGFQPIYGACITPPASPTFTQAILTRGLNRPWEIQYGPDSMLWITQGKARVSRVDPNTGFVTNIYTAPDYYTGDPAQARPCPTLNANHRVSFGTFGLALHPDFLTHPYIYYIYSYNAGTAGAPMSKYKVRRLTWDAGIQAVTNTLDIIQDLPLANSHEGMRMMIITEQGIPFIYITAGDGTIDDDRCYEGYNDNLRAQDWNNLFGKTLRFNIDGSIPADNPLIGSPVYTKGHRNALGLAFNPGTGIIYQSENGKSSDDELNIIVKGKNYGWPNARGYHTDYNYPTEAAFVSGYSPAFAGDALQEAMFAWCPVDVTLPEDPQEVTASCVVAPSDMLYYGDLGVPEFNNSLLVTTLKSTNPSYRAGVYAFKLTADGTALDNSTNNPNIVFPVREMPKRADMLRYRDITMTPDGKTFFICTDTWRGDDNKILKFTYNPVQSTTTFCSSTAITICPGALPYSWNGLTFTAAGSQTAHLITAVGYDSLATLELTVEAVSSSATALTLCSPALPYLWNGLTFTSAGAQTALLTNAAGCDSLATLELNVNEVSRSTSAVTICSAALPYLWNGLTFTAAGSQTAHLTNAAGCDSFATLDLTVEDVLRSTSAISMCPGALPYLWNGVTFTTAGSQTAHLINTVGCDSLATLDLFVNAITSSTSAITICPGALPYMWNGLNFTEPGTQTARLTNAAGCDSLAALNLAVEDVLRSTSVISVCAGALPYLWNGLTFTSAGSQTAHLTNAAGCDSLATLDLFVNAETSSTSAIAICPGALPYIWNGLNFTSAGAQTARLMNAAGCDSLATLWLTLNLPSSSTSAISICPGAIPYSWNGLTFTAAGSQTARLTNKAGCDSAATLQLKVTSQPLPIAGLFTKSDATCYGTATGKITVAMNNDAGAFLYKLGTTGAYRSASTFDSLKAGSCQVWVQDANGCISYTSVIAITQPPLITGTVTKSDVTCYGSATGIITVNMINGNAPFMYRLGTTGAYRSLNTFDSLKAGSYKVWVQDATGCTGYTNTIVISQPALITGSFTKLDATCYGYATGRITVNMSNGTAPYLYKLGTSGAYRSSNSFDSLKAGSYKVYVQDATGCAGYTNTIVISQPALITGSFTKSDVTCFGSATGRISVNMNNGTAPFLYMLGTTGAYRSTNTFDSLKAGSYKVYVQDATGCSGYTTTIVISQPALITGSFTKSDVTCFGSATGRITVNMVNGTSPFLYRLGATGAYRSINTFDSLKAGSYRVYVQDATGCIGYTNTIVISQPALITGSFTKSDVTCYGAATGRITVNMINGTAPFSYRLGTTGAYRSTNTFDSLKAGSYRVYVQDATGCVGYTGVIAVSQPTQIKTAVSIEKASCPNSPDGWIAATASGGAGKYQYQLGMNNHFQTIGNFNGLHPNTYKLYVTDTTGCQSTPAQLIVGVKSSSCPIAVKARSSSSVAKTLSNTFQVFLSPNPSKHRFDVRVSGNLKAAVFIRVTDLNGRLVYHAKGSTDEQFRFGSSFVSGTYFVEVRQGRYMKTLKAIKLR